MMAKLSCWFSIKSLESRLQWDGTRVTFGSNATVCL